MKKKVADDIASEKKPPLKKKNDVVKGGSAEKKVNTGPEPSEKPKEKKTRLTKKKLAGMTPEQAAEVTAASVAAKREARLARKLQKEIEEEDLRQSQMPKVDFSDVEWTEEETVFEPKQGWVVVLTPDGHIYQEPVPRYCSVGVFSAILCSFPEISENDHIRMDANLSKTPFSCGEIVTASYGNVTKRNNYASHFDVKNETSIVGGNMVFTNKDEKAFTKAQAGKAVKWVIKQLSKEENIVID